MWRLEGTPAHSCLLVLLKMLACIPRPPNLGPSPPLALPYVAEDGHTLAAEDSPPSGSSGSSLAFPHLIQVLTLPELEPVSLAVKIPDAPTVMLAPMSSQSGLPLFSDLRLHRHLMLLPHY